MFKNYLSSTKTELICPKWSLKIGADYSHWLQKVMKHCELLFMHHLEVWIFDILTLIDYHYLVLQMPTQCLELLWGEGHVESNVVYPSTRLILDNDGIVSHFENFSIVFALKGTENFLIVFCGEGINRDFLLSHLKIYLMMNQAEGT